MTYNKNTRTRQSDDEITRNMLKIINENRQKPFLLKENMGGGETQDPTQVAVNDSSFPGVLDSIKNSLQSKIGNISFGENPVILNKETKTVSMFGKIQNLNLDFSIDTAVSDGGSGLLITTEGMTINHSTIQTLQTLLAHAENIQTEFDVQSVENTFNI